MSGPKGALGIRLFPGILVLAALSQTVYSQNQTLLLPAIPGSLNPRTAYVIADKGQAYLYDPSAGLTKLPFLSGVHRSFGFSYNGRYFLYLKSNGALPGFSLYRVDLAQGIEASVASGIVISAAWSPAENKAVFAVMQSALRFQLVLLDFNTGASQTIFTGAVDPESIVWSARGDTFVFVAAQPKNPNNKNSLYNFDLHEYDVTKGKDQVNGSYHRGGYSQGNLTYSDALDVVVVGSATFMTVLQNGQLVLTSTDNK